MSFPREFNIGGVAATIDLSSMIPPHGENLMGLSHRMAYAQQCLNTVIHLLAAYAAAHKRLKAQLWSEYQSDESIAKKSVADFDRWITNDERYQRDLSDSIWLEKAYETVSRVHIPRLRYLENLAVGGQLNS